jgi:hypothetical protein
MQNRQNNLSTVTHRSLIFRPLLLKPKKELMVDMLREPPSLRRHGGAKKD